MNQPGSDVRKPTIRKDPKPRSVYGTSPKYNQLVNKDPDRHYVLVNQGDPDALSEYAALGYEVERKQAGGVGLLAGSTCKDGEPITMRGSILMSIDKVKRDEIEANGADGMSGQKAADAIEAAMIRNKTVEDPLRGMHGLRGANGQPFITVEAD